MTKIAALYSRVSTEDQVKRGQSIPDQKRILEKEAKKRGYRFRHYSDEALSGGSTKRAAFMRMLSDIESGEISALGVYDLSRASRDMLDSLQLKKTIEEKGLDVFSIIDNIDLKSESGERHYQMKSLSNEWYRKDAKKRATWKMWDMAKQGKFCGGQAPYGFEVKRKTLVINKAEAWIVRIIYNKFEELRSRRGLVVWLNSRGYKTKKGEDWATGTIKRILTNPVYKGDQTYGKRANGSTTYLPKKDWYTAKGAYQRIIEDEQFARVQDLIKETSGTKKPSKYNVVYVLSGLMRCECGGALSSYTQPKYGGKKLYKYYKCHNAASKGTCPGNTINKEYIEEIVLKKVKEIARLQFEDEEANKVIERNKKEDPKEQLSRLRAHIRTLRKKKGKLLELHLDGQVDKELLVKSLTKIQTELDTAEKQLDIMHPKEVRQRVNLLDKIHKMNERFFSLSDTTKKDIIKQLVSQILVNRDGGVTIDMYIL